MEKIKGLNFLMEKAVQDGVFPGVNYAIVTADNKYFGSFGKKSNYESVEENDIDTLYDMASCSKVVSTTTSIMKLLEQGKLRLKDTVCLYVKEFPYKDITIWDLLTHSSGLPADVAGARYLKSKEELFDRIFNVDLKYEKNTNIVYSDIGFILLGKVVENISGQTLDQFAYENIFKPLKMTSTGYNPKDINRCAPTELRDDDTYRGMVRGKVHDEKAFIMGGVAGHAGLFSCVKDLSNFIEMILNDGVFEGKQILSKATIDLLFVPQVRIFNGISLDCEQRGLGWIVRGDYCTGGDLASPETIHHTGFTGTNIVIDRINKIGFTILSNRVHPSRSNVMVIPWRARVGNYIIANFGGRNNGI